MRSIRTAPSVVAVVVAHGFRPLLGSDRLAAGASAPGDALGDGEAGLCGAHLEQVIDRVDDLLDAHDADDVAEIVAGAVDAGQASVEQAIVFLNVAVWSGTDKGASTKATLDGWVRQADDAVRLGIALHHECYPLPTRAEMDARLSEIALRFPEHRAVCERHIADRPAS
ncbi:hypothetical protein [Streptomyces virginiae]|uniref:hypothetical protein n=1 Tax=Streptomyces virginiae TaxID=1961 RepID=UPI0036B3699D